MTTLPAGQFRADLAANMVELGRAHVAFAYLRSWLHVEGGRRFGEAIERLAVDHGVIRMHRVGKQAAGRELDHQLHDGYPA